MSGLLLSDERYEEIKASVVCLFEEYEIFCTPISAFEIATKMGAKMRAYSTNTPEKRRYLLEKCPDGSSCICSGTPYIFYNDEKPYTRQNWTIMHEIGHIRLDHSETSDLAESEADFFAKCALVPPVLIHRYGLKTVKDVMERFRVSAESAKYALASCQRRYRNHPVVSIPEQKLCRLFNLTL